MWAITKWTKNITDNGQDIHTGFDTDLKEAYKKRFGRYP